MRRSIRISGIVQGVGMRPFVSHLADKFHLTGFIRNDLNGVTIAVEGSITSLDKFELALRTQKPEEAFYHTYESTPIAPLHDAQFDILPSDTNSNTVVSWILPDLGICPSCTTDIQNPTNCRFGYAFTNCTQCGPRYTIIRSLPYDRERTSMSTFAFCRQCQQEYLDHHDRRFHAEPIACPECGPQLQIFDSSHHPISTTSDPIATIADYLLGGRIIALKGLGGYQLIADATNHDAIQLLRNRKHRPHKPFAVMLASPAEVSAHCELSPYQLKVLQSPARPIVILVAKPSSTISIKIHPDTRTLGVMLPTSPLHQLLLTVVNRPLLCTSGNIQGEPIIFQDEEAFFKLSSLADYFLVHNRDILRHVDDSVVIASPHTASTLVLRRARGYAPRPLVLDQSLPTILSLGGDQKNTFALNRRDLIFLSPHLGEIKSIASIQTQQRLIEDYRSLFCLTPEHVACDLHDQYKTSQLAATYSLPVHQVQHHHAHLGAVMGEHHLHQATLGFAFDGTGLGPDHTIWGGEGLICDRHHYQRVFSLLPFEMIGGEQAIGDPKRIAFSLLYHTYGSSLSSDNSVSHLFTSREIANYSALLSNGSYKVITSSMGRLFDGIAALLGIMAPVTYEGQAAILLEQISMAKPKALPYTIKIITTDSLLLFDWRTLIEEIMSDLSKHTDLSLIAARFHHTVSELIFTVAKQLQYSEIIINGGCFQNYRLFSTLVEQSSIKNIKLYYPLELPCNDGGLSYGQTIIIGSQLCA